MADELFPIPSLPSYFVTKTGKIFRLRNDRHLVGYYQIKLRPIGGYPGFTTARSMGGKIKKLHRVMCEAFHGPPPPGMNVARHKDDNMLNNVPENLAWGTVQDNVDDSIRNGTFAYAVSGTGESHLHAKLSEGDVLDIRAALDLSARGCDLADAYNVSRATITLIKQRKNWGHL